MTLSPPSERAKTAKDVAFGVQVAFFDAMSQMCERVHRQAVRGQWPKSVVRDAVEHYGGVEAVEFWDEWIAS